MAANVPLEWVSLVTRAVKTRRDLLEETHRGALRLFNGYYEGWPELVVDVYGRTLLLSASEDARGALQALQNLLLEQLPWVDCVIQKLRQAQDSAQRRGQVTFGTVPTRQIEEHGVLYAVDLSMNQDASFYLDTRSLRQWLLAHAAGWEVLNTFAYTGSLGVAALAGRAAHVLQTDLSTRFLDLSQQSCRLNHLDTQQMEQSAADFFPEVARLKRSGRLFDCVIVDPPFFSSTARGRVDLVAEGVRLINKLRPLVRDGGRLVTINNALFLSGADTLHSLETLCAGGYMEIETLIPVPVDMTGCAETIVGRPPADPAPFNHPTKIAVLKVRRKNA